MSYKLKHSAEAIDYKLDLINKNKNLLPYPYYTGKPTSLEDVGDGSLLISGSMVTDNWLLNTFNLPAGTYTVSLEFADIIDTTKSVNNPGFSLYIEITNQSPITVQNSDVFTLDSEATLKVYLVFSDISTTDIIIKPQIEDGEEKTIWVPYMHDIGSYVDERFNGINTKLAKLKNLSNFSEDLKVNTITVGSTSLTETDLIKILNFIDSVQLEN